MATKLYVVCEYGWEYDDNYYYQGENNGAEPRKAYKSKEKAEVDCLGRNVAEIRRLWGSGALGDYVSESRWENLVSDKNREALFKLFNKHDVTVTDATHIDVASPDDLPDEFFEKLAALVDLSFYCVTTVEAELK